MYTPLPSVRAEEEPYGPLAATSAPQIGLPVNTFVTVPVSVPQKDSPQSPNEPIRVFHIQPAYGGRLSSARSYICVYQKLHPSMGSTCIVLCSPQRLVPVLVTPSPATSSCSACRVPSGSPGARKV